jgi:Rne/Rng family ribonuclease
MPGAWSATSTSGRWKRCSRASRPLSSTSAPKKPRSCTRPTLSSPTPSRRRTTTTRTTTPRAADVASGRELVPIQDVLKRGQDPVVQVSKEPISTKGPRVTAQVSLAGRFLVYMPFASRVGVSRKIGERSERAAPAADAHRTASPRRRRRDRAHGQRRRHPEVFERELNSLIAAWKRIKRKNQFLRAPALIHRETNVTRGLVRDVFSSKVDSLRSIRGRSTTRSRSTSRASPPISWIG